MVKDAGVVVQATAGFQYDHQQPVGCCAEGDDGELLVGPVNKLFDTQSVENHQLAACCQQMHLPMSRP